MFGSADGFFSFESNFTTICETVENSIASIVCKVDYCAFYLCVDEGEGRSFVGAKYSQPWAKTRRVGVRRINFVGFAY